MATFTTTVKHALRWLTGTNVVSDIDAGFQALAEDLDAIISIADKGIESALPTSSSGTPGTSGRWYFATDTGRIFFDYGTGWVAFVPMLSPVTAIPTADLYEGKPILLLIGAMMTAGYTPISLRYRAAASSHKWEAVGAMPWYQRWSGTSAGSATTTYAKIGNVSTPVEISLPWVGQYLVRWGYKTTVPASGVPSQASWVVPSHTGDLRLTAEKDRDATYAQWTTTDDDATRPGQTGTCLIQTVAANTLVGLYQRNGVAVAWPLTDPWLEFTVLRLTS